MKARFPAVVLACAVAAGPHGGAAAAPSRAPVVPSAGLYLATGTMSVVLPADGATTTACSTWGNSHGLPLTGVLQWVPWQHKAILRFGTLSVSRWAFTAARNTPFASQSGTVTLDSGGVQQLPGPAAYQMALTVYDADSFAGTITVTLPPTGGTGVCTQTNYITFLRMGR